MGENGCCMRIATGQTIGTAQRLVRALEGAKEQAAAKAETEVLPSLGRSSPQARKSKLPATAVCGLEGVLTRTLTSR